MKSQSKLKNFYENEHIMYLCVGILGLFLFIVIFGAKVINPTYVDWLRSDMNDLGIHYDGWVGYRKSSWLFPIGCSDTLFYPNKSSVIFTDSIPCMAVIFKAVSNILPNDFQYFGIWGILCFILQGYFGSKIMYNLTGNFIISVIGGLFFIITPCFIWRMFGHTALAGQWILLASLDLMISEMRHGFTKKLYLNIMLLGLLAGSIHIYFVPICGGCLVAGAFADLLKNLHCNKINRSIFRFLTQVMAFLGAAVLIVFLMGGS